MRYLVTGAAGFIGSHLVESLCRSGHEVIAVDCFTDYYDPEAKRDNARIVERASSLSIDERDLASAPLDDLLAGVDAIIHLAGQPGVRLSWSEHFALYISQNLLTTQRLLEGAVRGGVKRLILASSSSVYGEADRYPTDEHSATRPFSPYGVSKLAAESLCRAYSANWGIDTILLRYFTVYGPRQRPDMAMHRFIELALDGQPVPVFGDGQQIRDFTFVNDVVLATVSAATADLAGSTVINVAGGSSAPLSTVLDLIGESTGRNVGVDRKPAQPGDVRVTGGDIALAGRLLNWSPKTSLSEGVTRQVAWHVDRRAHDRRR